MGSRCKGACRAATGRRISGCDLRNVRPVGKWEGHAILSFNIRGKKKNRKTCATPEWRSAPDGRLKRTAVGKGSSRRDIHARARCLFSWTETPTSGGRRCGSDPSPLAMSNSSANKTLFLVKLTLSALVSSGSAV